MTREVFEERLRDPDVEVRAYLLGKLMRQAKPDDVFGFASMDQIAELWPCLERYLGKSRPFWTFVLDWWKAHRRGGGEAYAAPELGASRQGPLKHLSRVLERIE